MRASLSEPVGKKTSVIIPTLQAEKVLPELLSNLLSQTSPTDEIIIIDSHSTDDTLKIAEANNCVTDCLPRDNFRHGTARNLGARIATGDILIYLTQDALPVDNHFVEKIIQPICDGRAQAVYARQLPFDDAFPTERISRHFNYPPQSQLRTFKMLPKMGIRTFFFSNSASAVERDMFFELNGFSEQLIVNEDMDYCLRLLRNGKSVAYQADALVYHSHNYRLTNLFRRYFDIGVYFKQSKSKLHRIPVDNEGKQFFSVALNTLVADKEWVWIPYLLCESLVKLFAYQCGLRHSSLPIWAKQKLSGQAYFWVSQ